MLCKAIAAPALAGRPIHRHAPFQAFGRRAGNLVLLWVRRYRTRRALQALERHRLDDIGITPEEARREAAKPFWRP